jgi:hypothetical protein
MALPPCAAQLLNRSWQIAVFGRLTFSARTLQRQVQILLVQRDP